MNGLLGQLHSCGALRPVRQGRGRARFVPFSAIGSPSVLLTREHGKNGKMMTALSRKGFGCIELPLIEHTEGPDRARLPEALLTETYDWVAVTSPEAAAVYLEAWNDAGKPKVRVAVVGGGTGEVLEQAGVVPEYTATKATGKVMGAELPRIPGGCDRVLYPASAKASTDLQNSLEASGFTVLRLNTYNTAGVKAESVPADLLQAAREAQVVTFGSPSAVKAYIALVGLEAAKSKLSACIGSTSARACQAAGLDMARVYFPDNPGVGGWVDSVMQACQEHGLAPAPATAGSHN